MGVAEARVPSPAAWSVPLLREVQRGHAVAGGLHAHEEKHHSWDGCTQMRMLGESMELKDCVIKGFTLAFFFFFESLERMLEARSDWTRERYQGCQVDSGKRGWMERKSQTEAVPRALFQAEDGSLHAPNWQETPTSQAAVLTVSGASTIDLLTPCLQVPFSLWPPGCAGYFVQNHGPVAITVPSTVRPVPHSHTSAI